MKCYFRLLWLLLTRRRRAPCSMLGPCRTPFRVWPNDLDVFLHMNNGVYLTVADLGRTDLLARAGALGELDRRRWYPVVAAESIRFRRSLTLWQRYTIDTRVIGWNDRSIYLEQRFESRGETVARAVIDARFLVRGGGKVSPADVVGAASATTGIDAAEGDAPTLPAWVNDWSAAMRRMEDDGSDAVSAEPPR